MKKSLISSIIDDARKLIHDREQSYALDITIIKTRNTDKPHYHQLINFLDPKNTITCIESILLLTDDLEFDEDQFNNEYNYKKFNKNNYKIIPFSKIFKNSDICITITRKTLHIVTAHLYNKFTYNINFNSTNAVADFLAEITNCCNQIALLHQIKFDKLTELSILFNRNLSFTKSNLDKAIALEEKLEYLVIEPKFNINEYKEYILLLNKAKRSRSKHYQFTLNGIKFTITPKAIISIDVPGFDSAILINNNEIDYKKLALILENLNIFNKFKDNINYYLLTAI